MILRIKRKPHTLYPRWIEQLIRKHIVAPYRSFVDYIPLKEAAFALDMEPADLYVLLVRSHNFYAVQLENGQVFVHPDEVLSQMKDTHYERALSLVKQIN